MATPLRRMTDSPNYNRQYARQVLKLVTMPKPTPEQDPGPPDRDWLLDLATTLQTTLDIQELIRLFTTRSAELVPHDSIEYQDHEGDLAIRFGEPDRHSCSYDVTLAERNLGEISFTRSKPFTPSETTALENMLGKLMHPLRNALMYREALRAATKDPLTGVNNRAALDRMLEREVDLARRHTTPLSIIMLDADNFKAINDVHGHLVGDCTLKALADCITASIRDSDIVFRYGGEEFAIVLSNTHLDGAVLLAERVRKAVENLTVRCYELALRLTVSQGVASLQPKDDSVMLLEKADQALLQSKMRGRNRVTAPGTTLCPLPPQLGSLDKPTNT